jgi:SsrA-binding protein
MSTQADIASNKKARHDFDIVETYETGVVLRGTEVKSVRTGKMNLRDAFARVEKGEVLLHGCDIQPYENASFTQHDAKRPRKLLLHKKEILKLAALTHEKGYTLVALRAYWSGQRVKIELGVAKGKVKGDRREDLKKRVETREAERAVANFNRR